MDFSGKLNYDEFSNLMARIMMWQVSDAFKRRPHIEDLTDNLSRIDINTSTSTPHPHVSWTCFQYMQFENKC